MVTKKDVLIQKYSEFINDIKNEFDENVVKIFPSLDSFDFSDVLYLLINMFSNDDDYFTPLQKLVNM
jgi:hypothetical protein